MTPPDYLRFQASLNGFAAQLASNTHLLCAILVSEELCREYKNSGGSSKNQTQNHMILQHVSVKLRGDLEVGGKAPEHNQ